MTFSLLVGFYRDPNSARMRELISCLERNGSNDLFDTVYVFIEEKRPRFPQLLRDFPALGQPKIRLIDRGRRVSYRDMFAHANRELSGRRIVVANADIYFDQTLALLVEVDLRNKFLCLSRWDVRADGSSQLFDHTFSQDAWIFLSPICAFNSDFYMGLPGCDNRIAWEAQQAGFTVSNPSRTIRAYHLHMSGVRNYKSSQEVRGDRLGVPATTLDEMKQQQP